MLINRHEELNFALRTFRIFRHAQHIAQMLVICHCRAQCTQCLIRHRTQFVTRQVRQLTTVQTTFNAAVFHQTHDRTPARFGGHNLLAHFVIIAFQLAQTAGQVIHLRFAQGQGFFQLMTTGSVIAQLAVQFVATNTGALFRPAVRTNADILQLFMQIGEQFFFGIKGAFQ
ncbi:hypothetical protein D3C71_1340770 [compost metagenome]